MASAMGMQQQTLPQQDSVVYNGYRGSSKNQHLAKQPGPERQQLQGGQQTSPGDHNASFTSTKGLLNGPGQNNCFLNSAVQVRSWTRQILS